MERYSKSRCGCNYNCKQRTKQEIIHPIVDDPKSSNPHSLLSWLKRQLLLFTPVNNIDFTPTLPPTA